MELRGLHLWVIDLDRTDGYSEAWSILSEEEKHRAQSFRLDLHSARYMQCYGALRRILAAYLNVAPDTIVFFKTDYGKPYIDGRIRFNLSHSEGRALLGIIGDRELGVDVELVRPVSDAADIASRYFCPTEARFLSDLSRERLDREFLRMWTVKEAIAKCNGDGLNSPLDKLPALDETSKSPYSITPLDFLDEYVGAIVYPYPEISHHLFWYHTLNDSFGDGSASIGEWSCAPANRQLSKASPVR